MLGRGEADLVVQVADARNIRRALMLTAEIARFGRPAIFALNMVDEALMRGISIDVAALSQTVGVPVVEMVATEGRGLQELRDALPDAAPLRVPSMRDAAERAAWAHRASPRTFVTSARCRSRTWEALSGLTPGSPGC